MPHIAGGAVLLLLCACARIGLAGEPRAVARQVALNVELTVGGTANQVELLEPSIREMLTAKSLTVVTTRKTLVTAQDVAAAIAPPTESTPSLARVLLDFTSAGQATLFLIDPRRGRVYVRRMALPHGLDAVARASVRFMVEQSVDAIREGREIGMSREEFRRQEIQPSAVAPLETSPATRPTMEVPPAAAPAPAPPAPMPSPTRLLLAAGYELVALGSGEYQHGARVAVGARLARVQIAAAARLAAPVSIASDGVRARLSNGAVTLSAAGRILCLGSLCVMAGLGVGLDLTRVDPVVTTQGLQPAPAFWALGPVLQPCAQAERLFGKLAVAVAVFADVHLLAERYTVTTGGGTRDVFVPSRARPAGALWLGWLF
jgi:hypothetical protein